jgi:biopolymer transport protein ExbD
MASAFARAGVLDAMTTRADRLVCVRADQALAYQQVQSVMELASSSGARLVGMVAAETRDAHR